VELKIMPKVENKSLMIIYGFGDDDGFGAGSSFGYGSGFGDGSG